MWTDEQRAMCWITDHARDISIHGTDFVVCEALGQDGEYHVESGATREEAVTTCAREMGWPGPSSCENCKHWTGNPPTIDNRDWGDFGACALGESRDRPEHPETTAFAIDCDTYCASLVTKPGHCCSQWEAK